MTDGKLVVTYAFDPSVIGGVDDGQYFGIIIKVNADDDATVAQAGINMIMKIHNIITVPA